MVPVLFTFYIQCVLKLKKNNSGAKRLIKMADNSGSACMEQRVVMKFLVNEGVKPPDIYGRLQALYGDETLSRSKTFEWCKRFKDGLRSSVTIPAVVVPSPKQSFL